MKMKIPKLLGLALSAALVAAPAFAEKPEWAGGGGGGKGHKEQKEHKKDHKEERKAGKGGKHDDDRGGPGGGKHAGKPKAREDVRVGAFFSDRHRDVARTYYGQQYGSGKACPPGLAKKNNGCMPPGQAKKWAMGQPLPAGVVVYPVPQPVLVQLPPAPVGYKYVRVATDILLIAVGSQMVVDAISDLMRM